MSLALLIVRGAIFGAAVVALLWALAQRRGPGSRLAFPLAALLALAGLVWNASVVYHNFTEPQPWDFLAYYLDGRVAAAGDNFYEAGHYQRMFDTLSLPYAIDSEFQQTKLDFGFHYAPPHILMHYPLGFFSYYTAHILWVCILIVFLALDAAFLYRVFLRDRGWTGILAAAGLLLWFPPVRYALQFEQTTVLLLLPVILFWRDRERAYAGIWTALAFSIKPLGAFFGLYLLVRRRWGALAVAAGVFAALCGVVALLCGPRVIVSFFTPGRYGHVPLFQYSEYVNQSLLAEVLRRVGPSPFGHPLTHPVFIAAAAVIMAAALVLWWKAPREREEPALASIVPVTLLVYPGALNHYSMLLLPAILWLGLSANWRRWLLVGIIYALMPLNLNVWAHLFLFGVLAGMAWRMRPEPPLGQSPISADILR